MNNVVNETIRATDRIAKKTMTKWSLTKMLGDNDEYDEGLLAISCPLGSGWGTVNMEVDMYSTSTWLILQMFKNLYKKNNIFNQSHPVARSIRRRTRNFSKYLVKWVSNNCDFLINWAPYKWYVPMYINFKLFYRIPSSKAKWIREKLHRKNECSLLEKNQSPCKIEFSI